MSLIPFPTRELFEQQLPSFDLIILQNFEYLPYGIGDYLENIRSYVEGGGGLAMLGGAQSFTSGGYYGTPVAAALPVELYGPFDPGPVLDTQKFSPQLTDAGHDASGDVAALLGRRQPRRVEGAAAARGREPRRRARSPTRPCSRCIRSSRRRRGKPMPVIVAGDYGKGRSLAFTTDTLWRWGFVAAARPGDDGRQYTKLWENAIRWLIQDPDLRNLHVDSDAVEYVPGAPVRVTVRLLGRDYQPLAERRRLARRQARRRSGDAPSRCSRRSSRSARTAPRSTSSAGLDARRVPRRSATPRSPAARSTRPTSSSSARAAPSWIARSATRRRSRRSRRRPAARRSGPIDELPGDLTFDPPRIVRVDRRTDIELWSRPGLLILVVGLLGLEWLLRQRSGYL